MITETLRESPDLNQRQNALVSTSQRGVGPARCYLKGTAPARLLLLATPPQSIQYFFKLRMSDPEINKQPAPREPVATGGTTATSLMPLTMPYYFRAPWFPRYTGEPHTLKDFKDKMMALFKLYPVNAEQQMEILLAQLEGAARREVMSWPNSERSTLDQIFSRLRTTFEVRTASEVKMRFFGKKQKPGESLRDFAHSLQEALGAVVQIDPREADTQDQTLREQFIAGIYNEQLKTQLKMLSAQHPSSTFLDFKELAISILGQTLPAEPVAPSEPLACKPKPAIINQSGASQAAQAPTSDTVAMLVEQVNHLTKSLEKVCRKLEEWEKPVMLEEELLLPPKPFPPAYQEFHPRDPGRRISDRFKNRKRPVCNYCKKLGHTESTCWQLNGPPSRLRTAPREVEQ